MAVIEGDRPGGTHSGLCSQKVVDVWRCVSADAEDARGFGWDVGVEGHNWSNLIEAKTLSLTGWRTFTDHF